MKPSNFHSRYNYLQKKCLINKRELENSYQKALKKLEEFDEGIKIKPWNSTSSKGSPKSQTQLPSQKNSQYSPKLQKSGVHDSNRQNKSVHHTAYPNDIDNQYDRSNLKRQYRNQTAEKSTKGVSSKYGNTNYPTENHITRIVSDREMPKFSHHRNKFNDSSTNYPKKPTQLQADNKKSEQILLSSSSQRYHSNNDDDFYPSRNQSVTHNVNSFNNSFSQSLHNKDMKPKHRTSQTKEKIESVNISNSSKRRTHHHSPMIYLRPFNEDTSTNQFVENNNMLRNKIDTKMMLNHQTHNKGHLRINDKTLDEKVIIIDSNDDIINSQEEEEEVILVDSNEINEDILDDHEEEEEVLFVNPNEINENIFDDHEEEEEVIPVDSNEINEDIFDDHEEEEELLFVNPNEINENIFDDHEEEEEIMFVNLNEINEDIFDDHEEEEEIMFVNLNEINEDIFDDHEEEEEVMLANPNEIDEDIFDDHEEEEEVMLVDSNEINEDIFDDHEEEEEVMLVDSNEINEDIFDDYEEEEEVMLVDSNEINGDINNEHTEEEEANHVDSTEITNSIFDKNANEEEEITLDDIFNRLSDNSDAMNNESIDDIIANHSDNDDFSNKQPNDILSTVNNEIISHDNEIADNTDADLNSSSKEIEVFLVNTEEPKVEIRIDVADCSEDSQVLDIKNNETIEESSFTDVNEMDLDSNFEEKYIFGIEENGTKQDHEKANDCNSKETEENNNIVDHEDIDLEAKDEPIDNVPIINSDQRNDDALSDKSNENGHCLDVRTQRIQDVAPIDADPCTDSKTPTSASSDSEYDLIKFMDNFPSDAQRIIESSDYSYYYDED